MNNEKNSVCGSSANTPELLVGAAEIEITPSPTGTALSGGLRPRISEGVLDPLYIKAIVLETSGVRFAYVIFDLCTLMREIGDVAVAMASESTGIPPAHIVWSTTHTHSGPYTRTHSHSWWDGVEDEVWLEDLPRRFAACVQAADAAKKPGSLKRYRGYCHSVSHHRRLEFKDKRVVNTWLLQRDEKEVQCIGSCGPVDPEVGVLVFEGESGGPLTILYNFALHANACGGMQLSADYPGVVSRQLREHFGPETISLYMPGACGNINPVRGHLEIGEDLGGAIIRQIEEGTSSESSIHIGSLKREVALPRRVFCEDDEERLQASQWPPGLQEYFRIKSRNLQEYEDQSVKTIIQAFHIGDIAFVCIPGELFVEWGMQLKRESPFPWTYPVELCNDCTGYLTTEQAFKAGGYEPLHGTQRVSVEGVRQMIDMELGLLNELHESYMKVKT